MEYYLLLQIWVSVVPYEPNLFFTLLCCNANNMKLLVMILVLIASSVLIPLGIFGTEEDAQNWAKYRPV